MTKTHTAKKQEGREGERCRQREGWNSNERRWAGRPLLSITVPTLLLAPRCDNVPPRLPAFLSHPLIPSVSFCLVLLFLSSTAGENQQGGVREIEGNVWEKQHTSIWMYKAISVPVKPCHPSAVCPPHPLSSYQSVYSAWHCFLSPRFQREREWSVILCFHMRTLEQLKKKGRLRGGRRGKARPCFIHASRREGMNDSMPVRGGGEVVQEWKVGPLWTVPLLIEMYPTQANPTSGWIFGANAPFSLRGAPVRVKGLLGSSMWGNELDVPLDGI